MKMTNESGRSMVEMLGVLAIIGVLSIGGIAGYTLAMNRYRANEALNLASQVAIVARSANGGAGATGEVTTAALGTVQLPTGVTSISTSNAGSTVSINLSDDGAGLAPIIAQLAGDRTTGCATGANNCQISFS